MQRSPGCRPAFHVKLPFASNAYVILPSAAMLEMLHQYFGETGHRFDREEMLENRESATQTMFRPHNKKANERQKNANNSE
jgi:hypothetical protein